MKHADMLDVQEPDRSIGWRILSANIGQLLMFFQEIMAQNKILRVFPESLNHEWRGNNVSVGNVVDC